MQQANSHGVCPRLLGGFAILDWREMEREKEREQTNNRSRLNSQRLWADASDSVSKISENRGEIELKLFDYDQRPDWLAIGDESSESAMT